jgi:hypothetical protein
MALTFTVPTEPAGAVAVQLVDFEHVTLPAGLEPNMTTVPPGLVAKFVPVMVTLLPPILGPEVGLRAVMVGTGAVIVCVAVAGELAVKCMELNAVSADEPVRLRAELTSLHATLATLEHESKDWGSGDTPYVMALVPVPSDPVKDVDTLLPPV